MVGAAIVSGIGIGVGSDRQSKRLRRALDCGIERGALGSRDADFFRNTQRRNVVKIQAERKLLGWDRRMLAEVFRATQPLLLSRYRHKVDSPLRRRFGFGV